MKRATLAIDLGERVLAMMTVMYDGVVMDARSFAPRLPMGEWSRKLMRAYVAGESGFDSFDEYLKSEAKECALGVSKEIVIIARGYRSKGFRVVIVCERLNKKTPETEGISEAVLEPLMVRKGDRRSLKPEVSKVRSRLHEWLCYWMAEELRARASHNELEFVYVSEHRTTKTCWRCGSGGTVGDYFFECNNCGLVCNRDFNASMNLHPRYLKEQ